MIRIGEVAALAAILTACGGPQAGGQATPPTSGGLDRIHLYEVASDAMPQGLTPQSQEAGWIEVSGSGSVQVTPDRARVAFAMETRADAADAAAGRNADAMDAVLRAIREANFDGLTLSTFGYTLQPEYSATNNQRSREIAAYTVLNNVAAITEDVDAVGRIVDVAIAAGANRVSSISFFASDTDAARSDALAQAVRNARAEAEVIAEALGYRLGAPLEINGGAQRPMPRGGEYGDAVMLRAAATPIEVGDQTVQASVSIRFALSRESGG
ncbi:MAG: SIMPL domain-containing protein [Gemmatimonadetes bacterium]|nr:SIMPL domain-containing protein [Gemmatimonadota bacterium]MDA1104156.1 SIMPL domain-containing protein [Gemmatimonadota bacterium]